MIFVDFNKNFFCCFQLAPNITYEYLMQEPFPRTFKHPYFRLSEDLKTTINPVTSNRVSTVCIENIADNQTHWKLRLKYDFNSCKISMNWVSPLKLQLIISILSDGTPVQRCSKHFSMTIIKCFNENIYEEAFELMWHQFIKWKSLKPRDIFQEILKWK